MEILDHRRVGGTYEISVPNKKTSRNAKFRKVDGFDQLILARFIQELYFLHKKGEPPGGRFDCSLQGGLDPGNWRIVLVPAVPMFRKKPTSIHKRFTKSASGCEIGDIRGLLKSAIKKLNIEVSTENLGDSIVGAAEWLEQSLPSIPIPINFPSTKLISEDGLGWICASVTEKMGSWPACYYEDDGVTNLELRAPGRSGPPMRIRESSESYSPDPDSPRFRIVCRSKPQPWEDEQKTEFELLSKYWTGCLGEWSGEGNLEDKVGVRMRATLEAEKFQLLRGCYAVKLMSRNESGAKKGEYGYRLLVNERHPLFGDIKRDDGGSLLDSCIENATYEVCINNNPNPLDYSGAVFRVNRTKDDDPNVLILLDEKGKKRAPEKGWMRVQDIGTRTLQNRKRDIVSRAIHTQAVRNGLWGSISGRVSNSVASWRFREWEDSHPNWRISCYGNLQLVQGPPGTGKTWTATRLVEDILRENPHAKILLCAKEHLALDHLANSVKEALGVDEFRGLEVSRIVSGRRSEKGLVDERLDPIVLGRRFAEEVLTASESISKKRGYRGRLGGIRKSMVQKGHPAIWPSNFLKREAAVVCVTTADDAILNLLRDARGEAFDYAIVEEAGKSYPSELLGAVAISRNTILIGDQMQLPPFEIKEIRRNLLRIFSTDFKKLRKEKSKDRGLINLLSDVRFSHSIWDRDSERHVQDDVDNVVDDIKPWLEPFRWLFELFGELNDYYVSCKEDGETEKKNHGISYIDRLTSKLEEERRMFEDLSDVVGEVFYGNPFIWMKDKKDCYADSELPAPHLKNDRLLLIDCPHCSVDGGWREKRYKTGSYCNQNEAKIVAKTAVQMASGGHEVVVLSPYQGQVDLVKHKLGRNSGVKVHTVDGFQGKESDFILLSLVRNNDKTAGGRWGFVSDPNRLNVALSRAREGLILFTSLKHVSDSEFEQDSDYLGRAIEMIAEKGTVLTPTELDVVSVPIPGSLAQYRKMEEE